MTSNKEMLDAELKDLKEADALAEAELKTEQEIKHFKAKQKKRDTRRKHKGLFALGDATLSVAKDVFKVGKVVGKASGKVGIALAKTIATPSEADKKRMKKGKPIWDGLPG